MFFTAEWNHQKYIAEKKFETNMSSGLFYERWLWLMAQLQYSSQLLIRTIHIVLAEDKDK